jgi:drug/metabolite transporter (DMT)-like permease
MPTIALENNKSHLFKVILAFAAIYTIWGTTYLAIRIAVTTMPAFLMAGTRFLIAGALAFAFLRLRRVPMPNRLEWRSAAMIGAFLLVGGNGLVTWSEQQIPSSYAALVVATVPLWMTLFDWLFYRGPAPNKQISLGLILGIVGIVLLIGPGQLRGQATFDWISLAVLLLAPVLWSIGSLYSREAQQPANVFMTTAMEMLAGGALLIIAGLLTNEASQLHLSSISTDSWLAMLYLTVFGSIVALTAYVWLLKTVRPTRVATYTYVNPVIAVALGWLVLSEPITRQTLVAVAVIIVAVMLITSQRDQPEAQPDIPPMATAVSCESAAAGD